MIGFYVGNRAWKKLLINGIQYCVAFMCSLVMYFSLVKLSVLITGIPLSDYRGMNSVGNVNPGAFVWSVFQTYIDYFRLMTKHDVYQLNPTCIMRIVFIIFNVITLILLVFRLKKKDDIINKIGLVTTIVLMPLAMFLQMSSYKVAGHMY